MRQLQSHHVARYHSGEDVQRWWWWGGGRSEAPGCTRTAVTAKLLMCRGDRLTWLKLRSTTVPAHRTWDWGPAVFTSWRFCSRILKNKTKPTNKKNQTNLKVISSQKSLQWNGNRCGTLFLISRTSFGLVFIGMNWLATAAWRTPSSFDHCEEHTQQSKNRHENPEKKSKIKMCLKLCRLLQN